MPRTPPSPQSFDELMGCVGVDHLDDVSALDAVASLTDLASDRGSAEGLHRALRWADALRGRLLHPESDALLWYFTGNAWSGLRILRIRSGGAVWDWEQPELREEILALRRAVGSTGLAGLDPVRRCQIATNLGNVLSHVGRFVEALAYYDRALAEDPAFGMALGNRGQCLISYASEHYDPGHRAVMIGVAAENLQRALMTPLEPGVSDGFNRLLIRARAAVVGHFCADPEQLHRHTIGEGAEAAFRGWALRERLFLNPLNDLGAFSIAARDMMLLPTMTVRHELGTAFMGFYNQLKQEFAAARFFAFEGLTDQERHFADKDVILLDTLDRTQFGLAAEKLKVSFRLAYSLLDKVSVFLARYFEVSEPVERITFRNLWYRGLKPSSGLWPRFDERPNWPLRGLFWLSKDLHEKDGEYHAAIEPDAREVAKLRNHLEHQYVKVRSTSAVWTPEDDCEPPPDPIAYRIGSDDLAAKTLRMLKTARAALIYLSVAVHAEERKKISPPESSVVRGALAIKP